MARSKRARYVVRVPLTWDDGAKRAEPGETRDDLNPRSIPWLLEQGLIEKADGDH